MLHTLSRRQTVGNDLTETLLITEPKPACFHRFTVVISSNMAKFLGVELYYIQNPVYLPWKQASFITQTQKQNMAPAPRCIL